MNVQRLIIATVSLSVSLALPGVGLAQEKDAPIILGNVEGNCVSSPSMNPTGANAGDWTITCGDITPGSGLTVIAPPTAVNTAPPREMAPAPAPEPAPVTTTDTTATDTTVATPTDLDADNIADEMEWELGLDPSNADTDGDGVADGDEPNIYGTNPTLYDTDGDGLSDGEELFGIFTDPLVWNDPSAPTGSTQTPTQEIITDPVEAFE
jgi:hypothetical protein